MPENGPDTGIVDRFYAGMTGGDIDAARACCRPDAVFWHCFDAVEMDLESSVRAWTGLHAHFRALWVEDARREPIGSDRILARHVFAVRGADGLAKGWPVCLVVTVADGLIARIDEYIDRAGALPLDARKA